MKKQNLNIRPIKFIILIVAPLLYSFTPAVAMEGNLKFCIKLDQKPTKSRIFTIKKGDYSEYKDVEWLEDMTKDVTITIDAGADQNKLYCNGREYHFLLGDNRDEYSSRKVYGDLYFSEEGKVAQSISLSNKIEHDVSYSWSHSTSFSDDLGLLRITNTADRSKALKDGTFTIATNLAWNVSYGVSGEAICSKGFFIEADIEKTHAKWTYVYNLGCGSTSLTYFPDRIKDSSVVEQSGGLSGK